MKHSPEPWVVCKGGSDRVIVNEATGEHIACAYATDPPDIVDANAHRIVECVNTLAGVEDPGSALRRLVEAADWFYNAWNHRASDEETTEASKSLRDALEPFKKE